MCTSQPSHRTSPMVLYPSCTAIQVYHWPLNTDEASSNEGAKKPESRPQGTGKARRCDMSSCNSLRCFPLYAFWKRHVTSPSGHGTDSALQAPSQLKCDFLIARIGLRHRSRPRIGVGEGRRMAHSVLHCMTFADFAIASCWSLLASM